MLISVKSNMSNDKHVWQCDVTMTLRQKNNPEASFLKDHSDITLPDLFIIIIRNYAKFDTYEQLFLTTNTGVLIKTLSFNKPKFMN